MELNNWWCLCSLLWSHVAVSSATKSTSRCACLRDNRVWFHIYWWPQIKQWVSILLSHTLFLLRLRLCPCVTVEIPFPVQRHCLNVHFYVLSRLYFKTHLHVEACGKNCWMKINKLCENVSVSVCVRQAGSLDSWIVRGVYCRACGAVCFCPYLAGLMLQLLPHVFSCTQSNKGASAHYNHQDDRSSTT